MADDGFNGSTVIWNSADAGGTGLAFGPLLGCSDDSSGAEVPVTGAGDTEHSYVVGITDQTVTVDFGGTPAPTDDTSPKEIAAGQKGALSVTWNDDVGTQGTLANGIITRLNVSGSLDGPITGSITVRPTVA